MEVHAIREFEFECNPSFVAWVAIVACASLADCAEAPRGFAEAPWTEASPYRIELVVEIGADRTRAVSFSVASAIDAAFERAEDGESMDSASVRFVEVGRDGAPLEPEWMFQHDSGDDRGAPDEWVVRIPDVEAASETRRLFLYFDTRRTREAPTFEPEVELTEGLDRFGQESLFIVNATGEWIYHTKGAGFASLVDHEGNDWIGWNPNEGSAGEYRGIPNLVYPEGYFHAGGNRCETRITGRGPLRIRLASSCDEGRWAVRWEIYSNFALLTVLRAEHPYWFLYEGTPGGKLDVDSDYVVLSTGRRLAASDLWNDDLPHREWLCFGDERLNRVLVLAHLEDDSYPDAYYAMEERMTVFGFGRSQIRRYVEETPARFAVGLHEGVGLDEIDRFAVGLFGSSEVEVGEVERRTE